jgi:hypothetical protein
MTPRVVIAATNAAVVVIRRREQQIATSFESSPVRTSSFSAPATVATTTR